LSVVVRVVRWFWSRGHLLVDYSSHVQLLTARCRLFSKRLPAVKLFRATHALTEHFFVGGGGHVVCSGAGKRRVKSRRGRQERETPGWPRARAGIRLFEKNHRFERAPPEGQVFRSTAPNRSRPKTYALETSRYRHSALRRPGARAVEQATGFHHGKLVWAQTFEMC